MITAEQAWERFANAATQMDRWMKLYEARYASLVEHLRTTAKMTKTEAQYTIDSVPSYEAQLTYRLTQYKWYRDEAKAWKDVWQAIRDRDQMPASTDW